jgi:O-succinylbenzoate synthase
MHDDGFLIRFLEGKASCQEMRDHMVNDAMYPDDILVYGDEDDLCHVLPSCTDEELEIGLDYANGDGLGLVADYICEEIKGRDSFFALYVGVEDKEKVGVEDEEMVVDDDSMEDVAITMMMMGVTLTD